MACQEGHDDDTTTIIKTGMNLLTTTAVYMTNS